MIDQELEKHISSCNDLMKSAMARYELSGCLSDRGEADGWRVAMSRAIAARGPAVVEAGVDDGEYLTMPNSPPIECFEIKVS
ncbi:MAG: hypothetical protein JJD98_02695 [Polaromonas sp.]|nr:hypothetical protein [Polaromonas sp.]